MPTYPFECECGKKKDVFAHITETFPNPTCECGKTMRRDWTANSVGSGNQEFGKPIEMFSVALNDRKSIQEFQQRNPGVQISTNRRDPLYGVPIATTRSQKLSILQNEGYVEKN